MLHCQEAIPSGESTPVLLAVLRDPNRGRRLSPLPGNRLARQGPQLHVLDEATWSAIQPLAASGLLTVNTRATRHLTGEALPIPKPALTPGQLQRIADLRAFAAKKEKVARLLIAEGLADEAGPHQKAAEKALAEAAGIESHP